MENDTIFEVIQFSNETTFNISNFNCSFEVCCQYMTYFLSYTSELPIQEIRKLHNVTVDEATNKLLIDVDSRDLLNDTIFVAVQNEVQTAGFSKQIDIKVITNETTNVTITVSEQSEEEVVEEEEDVSTNQTIQTDLNSTEAEAEVEEANDEIEELVEEEVKELSA